MPFILIWRRLARLTIRTPTVKFFPSYDFRPTRLSCKDRPMNEPITLNDRMERLERGRNQWRFAVVVMLLVGALTFLAGSSASKQAVVDVLRAERYIVVDAKGRTMIDIGVGKNGTPVMDFNDHNGKRRIVVGFMDPAVPSISLLDTEGHERIGLKLHPEMGPSLGVVGPNRNLRSLLGLSQDGSSTLGLLDKDGNVIISIGVDPEGSGAFRLRQKDGKVIFQAPSRP